LLRRLRRSFLRTRLPPFWSAIAQFEKAGLVAKLAAARKRKRVTNGKCEGRKSLAETNPNAVALAKALSRKRPKGGQLSLRAVSAAMASQGFLNERGLHSSIHARGVKVGGARRPGGGPGPPGASMSQLDPS
jgi:hypothetical protein